MKMFAWFAGLMLIPAVAGAGAGSAQWAYEGEQGPEHWAELSDAYALCAEGMNQSPVDLVADVQADLPELIFDYHESPLREEHNGHTIKLDMPAGNVLRMSGKDNRYEAVQAHFHSPSEHTVGGRQFDMEVHIVHQDKDGLLAVVGILIEEGKENPVLNRIWAFMPEKAGDVVEAPISISETGLLPPTRDYFTYNGSLTTPPCSEGVTWIVLKQSIEASAEQVQRFKERVGEASNRPVQPHNARLILD
jgi:carbonic anhydrase